MKTLFFYTQDKKRLVVSAQRRADGQIQARFQRPDGSAAFQALQPIPSDASYFNAVFDLDFTKLTPGDYTVKIDYVAPNGTVLETCEQAYRVPGEDSPEFIKYVDSDADKVPPPWTLMKSDGNKVETWGRKYDFSGGFLFSSLQSQGQELLAAPAALRLNGKDLPPGTPPTPHLTTASALSSILEKNADLGELKVESRIKTHFDGFCEIAMTIIPGEKGQKVNTLSLDIPLRGDITSLVRDNKILHGGKSGNVGDYWCQSLIDNPFIWVGDEKIGFNWLAPNLKNWHCRDNAKNVEIIRQGDTATLRLNLIDTPTLLDKPRTINFGFTLTPSKPLDPKIQRGRIDKDWQMWCQRWRYFAQPEYDTANRGMIAYDGKDTTETFLYLGYNFVSPFSPEWGFWEEEWRCLNGSRAYGEWDG